MTSSSDLIFVLEFCTIKKQIYFLGQKLYSMKKICSVKERENCHAVLKNEVHMKMHSVLPQEVAIFDLYEHQSREIPSVSGIAETE